MQLISFSIFYLGYFWQQRNFSACMVLRWSCWVWHACVYRLAWKASVIRDLEWVASHSLVLRCVEAFEVYCWSACLSTILDRVKCRASKDVGWNAKHSPWICDMSAECGKMLAGPHNCRMAWYDNYIASVSTHYNPKQRRASARHSSRS